MALEDLTGPTKYLNALVIGNPVSNDDRREGDDHIRGLKNVLRNTFPNVDNAITLTDEQLNGLYASGSLVALLKAQNLADLPDKAASRANLGVYSTGAVDGTFMNKGANLADVNNVFSSRVNLGSHNANGSWTFAAATVGPTQTIFGPAGGTALEFGAGMRNVFMIDLAGPPAGQWTFWQSGINLRWEATQAVYTMDWWVPGIGQALVIDTTGAHVPTASVADYTSKVASCQFVMNNSFAPVGLATWADKTATRAINAAAIQNVAGRPMYVYTAGTINGSGARWELQMGPTSGGPFLVIGASQSSVAGAYAAFAAGVVPHAWFYRVVTSGSTPALSQWNELV